MARTSGSKNLSAEQLRERAEKAEARMRIKLAKTGVVLPALATQAQYVAQVKPGQRDLTDRFARIQEAIDELADLRAIKRERAEHPEMGDVPGGKTGLVTFTYAKSGEDGAYAKVSKFDAALDGAIQDKLEYISRELGQLSPSIEVTIKPNGTVGTKPPVDYSVLSIEELEALRAITIKLEASRQRVIEAKPEEPKED